MDFFTDEHRHPYFHCNNLWFDLEKLHAALVDRGSVLGLPLIRNAKTVDPTDPGSPKVVQVETAMGAAIEVFEGAQAIVVGRDRFLPVKTTDDLLLLRSDAYTEAPDGTLQRATDPTPLVQLDPRFYRTMADFDAQVPRRPAVAPGGHPAGSPRRLDLRPRRGGRSATSSCPTRVARGDRRRRGEACRADAAARAA